MKIIALGLLCCLISLGQTVSRGQVLGLPHDYVDQALRQFPQAPGGTATVSFTPQGSLPWLPSNVGTDYLIVCAPSGTSVPAGAIYQVANQHRIAALSPITVKSLLYRRQSMNKLGWAISLAKDAAVEIPILGTAKVISMSTPWIVALLASNPTITRIENQLQTQIPDPTPTIDLLLDPGAMLLFSGPCFEATIGVVQRKKNPSGTFVIP